jgi:hypothetical protein
MALTRDLFMPVEPRVTDVHLTFQDSQQLLSVHSRLRTDLNSATAKAGDPVEAVVTQPVVDAQNRLIIPQNSILHGTVLGAAPARSLGRNGALRFSFNQITWPSGFHQDVQAIPTAVESAPGSRLALDQEGGATSPTNRALAVPLAMGLLSAAAIGDDESTLANTAASSNGFAILGRLTAVGIGSHYVAGAIGAAGTARTVYYRYLAHGKEMHFGSDTEVLLEMTPSHAHRMMPVQ